MSFIEKKSNRSFILTIYVKPNSHGQKIEQDGKFLAISLKSKARRNKANKELLKLLKNKLNVSSSQVRFIAGLRDHDKLIEVQFSEEVNEDKIKKKLLN